MNNQGFELPADFIVFDSRPCRYTKVCEESYDKFIWSLGWVWDDNVAVESAKQAFNGEVFVNAQLRSADIMAKALREIAGVRFGWDGSCGVDQIANDALYEAGYEQ